MFAISFFTLALSPRSFPGTTPPPTPIFYRLVEGLDQASLLLQPSTPTERSTCEGSPNINQRGGYTLVNLVNNPDTRVVTNVGSAQGNCEGGTNPISLTVGGETTIEGSTAANVDLGVDFDGISIGGGLA
ncbi:hypothetical protein FB45DRAFT_875434 [Roridomyces roridus]|uniref:Uncharacterized protein n=1 Tax=Roridomyces roridus TaxID=1738132 RepID=A0AAD7B5E7_9AGAR|nr:hypothetical protein FB45DRAFT_875434 [Roridomyces roridus]